MGKYCEASRSFPSGRAYAQRGPSSRTPVRLQSLDVLLPLRAAAAGHGGTPARDPTDVQLRSSAAFAASKAASRRPPGVEQSIVVPTPLEWPPAAPAAPAGPAPPPRHAASAAARQPAIGAGAGAVQRGAASAPRRQSVALLEIKIFCNEG